VYNPYFLQVSESMLPTAPYNETHFNDPRYTALYNEGLATVDDMKRTEIVHEMQEIEYTMGGYVIPCFPPYIDGISTKVHGVTPGKANPLSDFGFERFWIE
jgi:peptide/nickel transport system substrate-binding protein